MRKDRIRVGLPGGKVVYGIKPGPNLGDTVVNDHGFSYMTFSPHEDSYMSGIVDIMAIKKASITRIVEDDNDRSAMYLTLNDAATEHVMVDRGKFLEWMKDDKTL